MDYLKLVEAEDRVFDLLEKAPADHPLHNTDAGEMWLEAKRAIREYFNHIMEKTL